MLNPGQSRTILVKSDLGVRPTKGEKRGIGLCKIPFLKWRGSDDMISFRKNKAHPRPKSNIFHVIQNAPCEAHKHVHKTSPGLLFKTQGGQAGTHTGGGSGVPQGGNVSIPVGGGVFREVLSEW